MGTQFFSKKNGQGKMDMHCAAVLCGKAYKHRERSFGCI